MLRKDLRIGLGIGAVLLLVLIVALIVKSNGKRTQLAETETTIEEPAHAGDGSAIDPTGGSVSPPPAGTMTPLAHADSVPPTRRVDPFTAEPAAPTAPGGSSDWEALLNGRSDGSAKLTETPTAPRSAPRGGGATAGLSPLSAIGSSRGAPLLPGSGLLDPPAPGGTRTPARSTAPVGQKTHLVRQGETFSSISQTAYGNSKFYMKIAQANPGLNATALKPGATVILPDIQGDAQPAAGRVAAGSSARGTTTTGYDRSREYKVEPNDSLYKISQKLYGDYARVDGLYELNKQAIGPDPRKLKLGMVLKLAEPPHAASGR